MASPPPRRLLAVAGSGDKENFCQLRREMEAPTAPASARRRKQPGAGGFNLRKSIAWNPAFFTEEGVLDNSELSLLSGSQVKPSGSTSSPSCRLGRSFNASLLKEVAENGPGKLRSTESKGRKLFSSAKTSDHGERKKPAGAQDKRSARSMQKCIPRPPPGNSQKKVLNSSATAQVPRVPKKSQPSLPMVPRSTSSTTAVSRSSKNLAPVKTEHPRKVDALTLTSKIKPTSLTKSSRSNREKDAVPALTAIREEAYDPGQCNSFSPPHNSPSRPVGMPTSTLAKPSALRMPSPSVGFFAQGMAHVSRDDNAQRNAERCIAGNASSLAKPPLKNVDRCYTANTPSLVKPPRCKQPGDLKGKLCLTKQLPTNCSAALDIPVQSLSTESTLNTLPTPFPGMEHGNVCSAKESLSRGIEENSLKSRGTDDQQITGFSCLLAESELTIQSFSSEKNEGVRKGPTNAYNSASHVQGIESTKVSHSLKANCSSTTEPIENSCFLKPVCSSTKPIVGSMLPSSCIPSQMCAPNDLDFQSKSGNCLSAVIHSENSPRATAAAVSLSEGNNCAPIPDCLEDLDSCYQQNTECSTLMESVGSGISVEQVIQCGSSSDRKSALADSKSDLDDPLCEEAEPTSEPNIDGGKELYTDGSLMVKEDQLLRAGFDVDHESRSTVCSPMQPSTPLACVDQEAQVADLSDLEAVKSDSKAYDTLKEEHQSVLFEETKTEDNMELDTNELSEGASHTGDNKTVDKSRTNTINKDHLKHLVPFTEEWLVVMEACGEEVLEQKSGAVQNSPTEKAAPEPSPWSPVKRKAQDVGPFDCTKYSKSVRTSTDSL